jgi:hypothetical protein
MQHQRRVQESQHLLQRSLPLIDKGMPREPHGIPGNLEIAGDACIEVYVRDPDAARK